MMSSTASQLVKGTHRALIAGRRRLTLAKAILSACGDSELSVATLLDVGCGDGSISALLAELSQGGVRVEGVELRALPAAKIVVKEFDGMHLPYETNSFDAVLLCDVLHHVPYLNEIIALLRECGRVASKCVIVKDHPIDNAFDRAVISLLDIAGNFQSGMPMPLKFLSRSQWAKVFQATGLQSRLHREAPFGIHPPVIRHFTETPFWSKPYHFIEILAPQSAG